MDWIYELKMDGFRCLAYMDRDSVDFRNKRNMQALSRFPELRDVCRSVGDRCILDGEVVVLVDGVPDFYRLQKRTLMTDRKRILSHLVRENSKIAVSRFVEMQGRALYHAAEEKKLEGVVAKRKESIYLMGRRTKDWIKFKRMADEEFIAAGYIQKGPHTFSLVLAKYREGVLVYQGHVTSGVTKADAAGLSAVKDSPFQVMPAGNEGAVWVAPDKVCVVEYMPNTQNALRQPVFKGFRDDVCPADVQMEN